jgi:hypothetical protein
MLGQQQLLNQNTQESIQITFNSSISVYFS